MRMWTGPNVSTAEAKAEAGAGAAAHLAEAKVGAGAGAAARLAEAAAVAARIAAGDLIDVAVVAAARAGAETRFESKGLAFHTKLREGFLGIAAAEPDRCEVIDATAPLEAVEAAVWAAARRRLGLSDHG